MYKKTGIDELVDYILSSGQSVFSRRQLTIIFELDERTVRQAFYNIKAMGMYVINDKDLYTVLKQDSVTDYYEEIQAQLSSDFKKALKLLKRVHKQNKALPQKYQIELEEIK